MTSGKLRQYGAAAACSLTLCGAPSISIGADMKPAAQMSQASKKVVIQVSDADPKKWALALNNAENVQEDLGKENVDVEIVAYGPGLAMLKLESEAGNQVKKALANGVKVVACENTMRKQKISRDDLLPNLAYAKAGVVELMAKQAEGYAYIRP